MCETLLLGQGCEQIRPLVIARIAVVNRVVLASSMRLGCLDYDLELGGFASWAAALHALRDWVGWAERLRLVHRSHVLGQGVRTGEGTVAFCSMSAILIVGMS